MVQSSFCTFTLLILLTVVGADLSNQNLRGLFTSLDARWKSTKLTQAEKAAMGLFPPPGEEWPDDPPELLAKKEAEAGGGTIAIIDTQSDEEEVETALDEEENTIETEDEEIVEEHQDLVAVEEVEEKKKAIFKRYESSQWEQNWLDHIGQFEQQREICHVLVSGSLHQSVLLRHYMELTCGARLDGDLSNWCYYHDHSHYMWYNTADKGQGKFEVYIDETPSVLSGVEPPALERLQFSSAWSDVASKMYYADADTGEEFAEYIEPIVGQLRFPLAYCVENEPLLADFAAFVLPPSVIRGTRTLLFDVGSKDWTRMEYLVEEWEARGAVFDDMISYSTSLNEKEDSFIASVPEKHQSKIYRQYFELLDKPATNDEGVFIPTKIQDEAQDDDYVVLKIDRIEGKLGKAIVEYILEHDVHVDELIWEVNVSGNYVLEDWMDKNLKFNEVLGMSMEDTFNLLFKLRAKGIRAHSWI